MKKIKCKYKIKCGNIIGNIITNHYNLEYKLKSGFANLTTTDKSKKSSEHTN